MKTIQFEPATNGYILRIDTDVFVCTDEVEVLEYVCLWLDLGEDIEVKRKE